MSTQPIAAYRIPSPVQNYTIDDGDAGTAQTVARMYQQIYEGMKDPTVNATAIGIVNAANPRPYDFSGQRRAIFNWIAKNIRFVRDPSMGVELVRTAPETLRVGGGDCDCMTVLTGALLATIGNHVRITTVESQPGNPDFSHVFLEVLDGNKWTPADPARPDARFARGPESFRRRLPWPNPYDPGAELGRLRGLNGYGDVSAKALNASYQPMVFARLGALRGLGRLSAQRRQQTMARLGKLRGLRGGRLGRLGQDDIDWSGIAQAVSAGTTGAANIIRATNTPSIANLSPLQLQQAAAISQTTVAPAGYVNIFGSLVPTNTLLMGAAAFALLMLWEKR
jgi:hypothetical protein